MSNTEQTTTRRTALKQLAAGTGVAASVFPVLGQNPPPEVHHAAQPVTKEVAKAYQYRFFSPVQLETLDALSETIIPKDDHSGGATAAHVSEYIDAVIADEPEGTKQLWRVGIATVVRHSRERFEKPYANCSQEQQSEVLQAIAGPDENDPFFKALKRATVDGYYTSQIGLFEDLEYRGNQAVQAFPGCQFPEIKSQYS